MSHTNQRPIPTGLEDVAASGRSVAPPTDGQTVTYAVESPFEHRIGHRVAIDGIPAAFSDRPGRTVPVRLVDVSVSGASMLMPATASPLAGTRGRLVHHGIDTRVDVRRVESGPDPSAVRVSVEFVELTGPLKDEIYALVAHHHSGALRPHPEV